MDAVMYATVVHYEASYLGLVAAWQVEFRIRLVSTHNGLTLIESRGSRWSVNVLRALTIANIAINAAANILQFRDVNLARPEEETCRELVRRIPISKQLIMDLAAHAREHEIRVEAWRQRLESNPSESQSDESGSYQLLPVWTNRSANIVGSR